MVGCHPTIHHPASHITHHTLHRKREAGREHLSERGFSAGKASVPSDQPQSAQIDADPGFQQFLGREGAAGAGFAAGIKLDDPMA